MSLLLWCKEITLLLLTGECFNANQDCKTISSCEMVCSAGGPMYDCNSRGLIDVPSFPETTLILNLSDNAIRTLNSDTFADNFDVFQIDLSNNNLSSVPDDVFRNNVILLYLNIHGNTLTTLPLNLFASNLYLDTLDISSNTLTSVPDAVFQNNAGLRNLDLSNNNLTSVPDAVFKINVALKNLEIGGNTLTNLSVILFSSNADLKLLKLSNNNLTSLPDDVIMNNKALTYLDISNNNLTSVPAAVFRNNVALKYLSLANNNLTSVPADIFRNNVALAILDLSNNKLTSVPDGVFKNNVALKYIDCKACFDCDCLSASMYQWILKTVKDREGYIFTCRNGEVLPNTVVNCSELYLEKTKTDDGLRLAVIGIQHESSCNCKESISLKPSSMDLTTETTPPTESNIDKIQHTTKTNDSSYTYIAGIISGTIASITLITAFTALRRFINTTSRIKHSDITDNEINKTINNGFDFIPTIYGEMAKKYNNIPPKSHMNTINDGIDVIKTLNYNGEMNKEYNNIPPKSHITLSSFRNIPYFHQTMVSEGNPTNGNK